MMGTSFRIIVYSDSRAKADGGAQAAFQRVEELNQIFSNYHETSEISRLATTAIESRSVKVSDELWTLLHMAEELKRHSSGAFDVSIGSLTKLWRRAIRRQELPDGQLIDRLLLAIADHKMVLDSTQQTVMLSGTLSLDFGGIAKGYAVDEAYQVLLDHDLATALVDGGGDIYAGDAPPGRVGWEIAADGLERVLFLQHEAVASSGSAYQYLHADGLKYSHIIDPRSGYGITDPGVSVVKASTCMMADAAASVLSILKDTDQRQQFLEKYPELIVIR